MNVRISALIPAAFAVCAAFGQLAVTPSVPDRPWTQGWWLPRFDEKRALAAQGGYPVVFVGDSITHNWERYGSNTWTRVFAEGAYKALNCGFSGDRTEQVLWRLDHGQLDGTDPKAIVLMIGTNNTGHRDANSESPTDTILGVQSILARMTEKWPAAKVILHPIFPRGARKDDPLRLRNDLVNSVIRRFADGRRVLWCDFNSKLLAPDGTLEKTMAPDLLHPGPAGYEIWAAALKPYLDYALGLSAAVPKAAAPAAPNALVQNGPRTTRPELKWYWLNTPSAANSRIRAKRAEECGNADRYYDAVWIGDSITHFWEHKGNAEVFKEKFGQYKILNLGFGGDGVQNTLWNLRHGGILNGIHTRMVTLMIGTNNTWGETAEDIAAGIAACVKEIRARQPQAKLILMPLIPREVAHKRGERDFRRKNANVDEIMPKQTKVNALIKPLADGQNVIWLDLVPTFTDKDGLPDIERLGDGTHPNAAGCAAWADAALPLYRQILGR